MDIPNLLNRFLVSYTTGVKTKKSKTIVIEERTKQFALDELKRRMGSRRYSVNHCRKLEDTLSA